MANFYSFICRCNCGWLLGFALQTITAGFEEADLVFWRFKSFKSMVHAGLAMVVAIPFVQVFYFDVGENQRGRFLKVCSGFLSFTVHLNLLRIVSCLSSLVCSAFGMGECF